MNATETVRARWVLRLRVLLSVGLAIAAVILGNRLIAHMQEDPVDVLEAGTLQPLAVRPYGQEHTVRLPTYDVVLNVGVPVRTLDHELLDHESATSGLDVRAPEGGSLLPLSWRFTRHEDGEIEDSERIQLRLVTDDESVDLESFVAAFEGREHVVAERRTVIAFDDELDSDDLRIEVTFDGVTQVLHVGSGDVETGSAQPLYEPERLVHTGCETIEDNCGFEAADSSDELVPMLGRVVVEPPSLRAWDPDLGWAEDGTLWARASIRCYDPDALDASGNFLLSRRMSTPKFTLAGKRPARQVGLTPSRVGSSTGTLVFAVPADQAPGKLVVRTTVTLKGGLTMPVRATTNLEPAP